MPRQGITREQVFEAADQSSVTTWSCGCTAPTADKGITNASSSRTWPKPRVFHPTGAVDTVCRFADALRALG